MRCPICLDPTDEYIDILEEDSGVSGLDTTIIKIQREGKNLYVIEYGSLKVSIKTSENISDFEDILTTFTPKSTQETPNTHGEQNQTKFQNILSECPVNIPSEYSDESLTYLRSFLSHDRIRELEEISNALSVDEDHVLAVALVHKNRSESSRYSRMIRYYVEERNRIRNTDYQEGNHHLSSDLFSLLLLFTALCEDLVGDILTSELLREEARLKTVIENEIVGKGSRYSSHLGLLRRMDIIDPEVYETLESLRKLRNDATHDVLGRKAFEAETDDRKTDLIEQMETALQCLLILAGRKAPHIICNYGPADYRNEKQAEAVKIAKEHWEDEHPDKLGSLESNDEIDDLTTIRWTPRRFDPIGYRSTGNKDGMGSYRVTNGVNDFDNLSPNVYAHLMNFVGTACGATRTVVNRDLHEANLSRQDFMLLSLLVSESDRANSITQVANRIFSTEQFVRRKHISLDWRTPASDKRLLCLTDQTGEILGLPDDI
ncbi:hypothetical protein ACLI4Z_18345 [Natrialbaceae archaeon A-arb3/5]